VVRRAALRPSRTRVSRPLVHKARVETSAAATAVVGSAGSAAGLAMFQVRTTGPVAATSSSGG
jgi:hypothetical protein